MAKKFIIIMLLIAVSFGAVAPAAYCGSVAQSGSTGEDFIREDSPTSSMFWMGWIWLWMWNYFIWINNQSWK